MFYNAVAEKTEETEKLHNSVNSQSLIHHFKGPTKDVVFNDFIDTENVFVAVSSTKIRYEDAEKNQMEFESKLSSIRMGDLKSNKQLSEIEDITNFYKLREESIKFCNDYFKVVHKAIYDAKRGKELKKLSSKQILQRLSIALAQVETDNTSENRQNERNINEIRQIIYYLYPEK